MALPLSKTLFAVVVVVVIVFAGWRVATFTKDDTSDTNRSENSSEQKSKKEGFDKTKHSIDKPGSIWWVVNKTRALPDGYVPPNLVVPDVVLRDGPTSENMHLRQDAAKALEQMFAAAENAGVNLRLASGYRSLATQTVIYNNYVAQDGQAVADTYSARPGTSEHQTGMAADIGRSDGYCEIEVCFGDTREGKWVDANAHKFGFIIRYPRGKQSITTYQYEPWHMRFVGKELAIELKKTGQTMEEFFGLTN